MNMDKNLISIEELKTKEGKAKQSLPGKVAVLIE